MDFINNDLGCNDFLVATSYLRAFILKHIFVGTSFVNSDFEYSVNFVKTIYDRKANNPRNTELRIFRLSRQRHKNSFIKLLSFLILCLHSQMVKQMFCLYVGLSWFMSLTSYMCTKLNSWISYIAISSDWTVFLQFVNIAPRRTFTVPKEKCISFWDWKTKKTCWSFKFYNIKTMWKIHAKNYWVFWIKSLKIKKNRIPNH